MQVHLAGVCSTDLEIMRGYKGFSGVLGHEFVGTVVEAPETALVGQRVCGEINLSCGECEACVRGHRSHCEQRTVVGIMNRQGAFAELLALPLENLHPVPDGVSDEQAVFVEPLAAAFEILEQVSVAPNDRVAVLGDGRLGILCAAALKTSGATPLLIGKHGEKLRRAEQLGARTALVYQLDEQRFDLVVEATGSRSGLQAALQLVRPRGTLVLKTTVAGETSADLAPIVVNELTVVGSRCGPFPAALDALERGVVDPTPLIDAVYPLEKGQEALRRAAEPGVLKVLIEMRGES